MKNLTEQPNFFARLVRRVVFLSLLLAWGGRAQAQTTVTGLVRDPQKQEAVGFATVVLKAGEGAGKVVQSTLTDEAGHFVLKAVPMGRYQLGVLMMGFAPHERELLVAQAGPELALGIIELVATSQALQEVTVVAQRPLLVQKPDRVTMNLDGSALALGNDAYNILAVAPAVRLVNGQLSFRGKTNVLILLNGKRLPGATLESVLASIPGDRIDRIELISNPSAKYDADASGGVIEIYTKRSKTLGWSANAGGNLSQGFRLGGGTNAGLLLSTAKFDVVASGGYSNRGDIERGDQTRTLYQGRTAVGSFAQNFDFGHKNIQNANLSGSVNYHLNPRNTVGFDVDVLRARLDGSGQVQSVIDQANGRTLSRSANTVGLQVDLYNYNGFWKHALDTLGSNLLLTTNYAQYRSQQQQRFDQYLLLPGQTEGRTSQFRNVAPAVYDIYTSAVDYTKGWSPNTQLEAGFKYTNTRNSSQQLAETVVDGQWVATASPLGRLGYQERISAAYLNLNHTVGRLSVQAGLRAEQTAYQVVSGRDSSYFNLFPKLRLDYKVSENYIHSFSYARTINRPSYDNLIPYELFVDNYTSRKGNARLRPEYAHAFSWNQLYRDFGLQLDYTQTTNAISTVYLYDPQRLRFIQSQSNFRQRHLASLTLSVPLKPLKWWSLDNSLSLLHQELSIPNPFDNAETFSRRQTYYSANSNSSFALGHDWTGQLSGFYSSASFSGMLDFGSVSNVTLGLKKSLWNKQASLKLSVSDLFYQANMRVSSSVVPVVTDGILRNDTRRVQLSFNYKFGGSGVKSRRVETNGNASELNRLGM